MWAERLLAVHPVILSLVYLALFALGGIFASLSFSDPTYMVPGEIISFSVVALTVLWAMSVYTVSASKLETRLGTTVGGTRIVFWLSLASLACFMIANPIARYLGVEPPVPRMSDQLVDVASTAATAAFMVVLFLCFASMWTAADALVRFEERKKAVPWNRTVGTFLLIFYLLIGIWFLWPRIKRVLAA